MCVIDSCSCSSKQQSGSRSSSGGGGVGGVGGVKAEKGAALWPLTLLSHLSPLHNATFSYLLRHVHNCSSVPSPPLTSLLLLPTPSSYLLPLSSPPLPLLFTLFLCSYLLRSCPQGCSKNPVLSLASSHVLSPSLPSPIPTCCVHVPERSCQNPDGACLHAK